jgi:hypothetical protein
LFVHILRVKVVVDNMVANLVGVMNNFYSL